VAGEAAAGWTSIVLGELTAALDTGVVIVSGVAAGCPPVAFGVGEIVDTPAESTVGVGAAVSPEDGVGAMEVERGAPVRLVGGIGDASEPLTRGCGYM